MPRNMVSGKPSNQSARGVDIPSTTCIWFFWLLGSTGEYVLQGQPGVYSALLVVCFSGNAFEDPTLPLFWPCALPEVWSVEWDPSPASTCDIE
jgi:hypothetical protein